MIAKELIKQCEEQKTRDRNAAIIGTNTSTGMYACTSRQKES